MNKNKKSASKTAKLGSDRGQQDRGSMGSRALCLEVDSIRSYERNPRRSKNPEYDRIKASILMSGMDQVLSITQRPGDTDYIVQAGGNTRLQILKELHQTTGEERFSTVDCWFVEWDRESAVLLAHLRENELRGNLSFIDKARAVYDIKGILAKELGKSPISSRELAGFLVDHGYSVSRGLISLMGYAVLELWPLLPIALESSLGKPQVQRVRNLERVGRTVWAVRHAGTEAEFETAFRALCERHDGIDWHFDLLCQALENEIAEAAEVSIQVVRMEFDCRLAGHAPDIPDFIHEDEIDEGIFPTAAHDETAVASEAERNARAISGKDGVAGEAKSPREKLHSGEATAENPPDIAIELPPEPDHEALFRRIGIPSTSRVPLALLRETAYALAQRLAERHGVGTLVVPLSDNGLGYLLSDIPPPAVVDQLDDEMMAAVATMWWQLMAFSEMTAAPADVLQTMLEKDSALSAALLADDRHGLSSQVGRVDPADLGARFWRHLNHEDWCDWLCLAHNYRELHRSASLMNTALWSTTA